MKRKKRGRLALVFCVVMFVFTACGKSKEFDAAGYVKSALDALYKGEYAEHAKYVDEDYAKLKKEMEEDFTSQVQQALSGKELTQEDKDKYCEFAEKLYTYAKYEVGESKEEEDGNYTVTVAVEPCTVWKTYYAGIEEKLTEFSSARDTFSDSELFAAQLDYMNECLASPAFDAKQEVTVRVTQNSNHVYSIPDEDMEMLENAMFPIE